MEGTGDGGACRAHSSLGMDYANVLGGGGGGSKEAARLHLRAVVPLLSKQPSWRSGTAPPRATCCCCYCCCCCCCRSCRCRCCCKLTLPLMGCC